MTFLEKLNQINQLLDKIKVLNTNVSSTNGFSALEADLVKQHLRHIYDKYSDLEKLQQLQNVVAIQHKVDSETIITNKSEPIAQEPPKVEQPSLFFNLPPQAKMETVQVDEAKVELKVEDESDSETFSIKEKIDALYTNREELAETDLETVENEELTDLDEESMEETPIDEEQLDVEIEIDEPTISTIQEEEPALAAIDEDEVINELEEDLDEIIDEEETVEEEVAEEEEEDDFEDDEASPLAYEDESPSKVVESEFTQEQNPPELEPVMADVEEEFTSKFEGATDRTSVVKESPAIEADHTKVSVNKVVEMPRSANTQKEQEPLSLFEKYQQRAAMQELNLKTNPVKSVKQLISLNDKFVIIKEFFGNAISKYDAMIDAIDKRESLDEALNYMESEVWNTDELRKKEELIKRVTAILNRKFMG
jgi:hypothetical protein